MPRISDDGSTVTAATGKCLLPVTDSSGRVTGSGIAPSATEAFSSGALGSVIMSAPVSDGPQSSGVSELLAPTGPVGHFSQAEAKATIQIKSLGDRPITIQTYAQREMLLLYFQA